MPTLPIYIRVDDLEKWNALTNKSEFVHNALLQFNAPLVSIPENVGTDKPAIRTATPIELEEAHKKAVRADEDAKIDEFERPDRFLISPKVAKENPEIVEHINKVFPVCKHGADPRLCKHAKNGKPCK